MWTNILFFFRPDNRRFHTKTDMRNYLEQNKDESLTSYESALMDFGVHLKLSRRMGWVVGGKPPSSKKRKEERKEKRKRKKLAKVSSKKYLFFSFHTVSRMRCRQKKPSVEKLWEKFRDFLTCGVAYLNAVLCLVNRAENNSFPWGKLKPTTVALSE